MLIKLVSFCVLLLSWCVIAPVCGQTATASLAGSWEFTLAPSASPAATAASIQIEGLATMTSDGSLVETDTSEVVPTAIAGQMVFGTPGHGIWQRGPAIGNWFVRFTSLLASPGGTLRGKRVVTFTIALNATGDRFNGGYGFETVDTNGRVISTGAGTVTGQVMPHPALP